LARIFKKVYSNLAALGVGTDYSKPPAAPGPALATSAYVGTCTNNFYGEIRKAKRAELSLLLVRAGRRRQWLLRTSTYKARGRLNASPLRTNEILWELKHLLQLHRAARRPATQVQALKKRFIRVIKSPRRNVEDIGLCLHDSRWGHRKCMQLQRCNRDAGIGRRNEPELSFISHRDEGRVVASDDHVLEEECDRKFRHGC
jgi:hypothetical protein